MMIMMMTANNGSVPPKLDPSTSPPTSTSNNYTATRSTTSPYAKDFLRETIRTYGILFPSWDAKTKEFLKRQNVQPTKPYWMLQNLLDLFRSEMHPQAMISFCPQSHARDLDLRKYTYWRDRLLELYEEVYLSPPVGLKQMWRDRRNPEKYSTFLIGIMIFVLTIMSTVTGIIQTGTAIEGIYSEGGVFNLTEAFSALCRNFSATGTCTIVVRGG